MDDAEPPQTTATSSDTPPWRIPKGSPVILGPAITTVVSAADNNTTAFITSMPSQSPVVTLVDANVEAPPGKWRKCETQQTDTYQQNSTIPYPPPTAPWRTHQMTQTWMLLQVSGKSAENRRRLILTT